MSDKSISEVFSAELAKSGDAPTPVSKDELKEWMEKNNGMSEKKAEAAVENATTPAKDALSVALDGRDDEPPKIPEGYNGGESDDEKADKDGLVYITRTFTIDPAKYRSANYQPKDKYGKPIPVPKEAANPNEETAISDISLDKETVTDNGEVETVEEEKETATFDERSLCYDEGELFGEYDKGDVPVMDTRRAPTRETCETDITQCRAANPLFCRFHGPKLIEADIKKSLRLSGLAGCRVAVTRDATSDNPRAFKLTVACRPEQRERAEEAIDAFLREPGVTPTGERAYENGKLSNYYEMDLERVDRPPRANREPKAAAALRRNQTTPQGTIRGNGQEPRAAAQPRRRPRRPTLADFQPASQPQESQPVQNEAQQQTQPPQQETPSPQQNVPAQPPPQQTQQEGGQDGNRSNRIGLRDALYTVRAIGEIEPFLRGVEPRRTGILRNIASGENWPEDPDVVNDQGVTRRGAAQAILDEMSRRGNLPDYMLPVQRAMQRVANLPRAGEEQHPQQNGAANQMQMPSDSDLHDAAYAMCVLQGLPDNEAPNYIDGYRRDLEQLITGEGYPADPDRRVNGRLSRRSVAENYLGILGRAGLPADLSEAVSAVRTALQQVVDLPRAGQQAQQNAPAQQNGEPQMPSRAEIEAAARDLRGYFGGDESEHFGKLNSVLTGGGWPHDPDRGVGPMNATRRASAFGILNYLEAHEAAREENQHQSVRDALRRIVDMPRGAQQPQQPQQPQQNSEQLPYTEAELDDVVQRIANRYNVPAAQVRSDADSYLRGNNLSQLRNMQQYMRDVGVGEDHPVARHVAAMIEGAQRAEADRHRNDLPMPNKPQSVRKPTDTITQDELNSIRAENESFWQGKDLGTMKQYFLDAMSTVCSTEEVAAQDNALANETMGVSRQTSPLTNPIDSQYGDAHGCNCWKAVATAILRLRGFDLRARYRNQVSPVFAGTMAEGGAQRLTFAVSQRAMGANYERIAIPEAKMAELHEMYKRASNARYPESARLYDQISHEIGETMETRIEEILKGKTNEDGTCTPPYPDGTVLSVWDGGHCTLGMVYKGNLIKANPWGDSTGLYTSRMSGSIISGIQSTFNIVRIKNSVEDFRRRRAINPRFQYDVRESEQAEHKNNVMTFMMVQRRLRRQNPNVTDEEVYRNIPLDKDWADINGSYIIRPDQPLIKEMFGLAQKV